MAVSSLLSVLDDFEQKECDILAMNYCATAPVSNTHPTVKGTAETNLTEEEGKDCVLAVKLTPRETLSVLLYSLLHRTSS